MKIQSTHQIFISITLAIGAALVVGVCTSSTVHTSAARYPLAHLSDLKLPVDNPSFYKIKVSSSWANQPWTGDDLPYQHIQKQVDTALAGNEAIGHLLGQASLLARQKPTDPQAQFRWSYTARQVILEQPQSYDPVYANEEIALALARANSPETYSYARLRFLVTRRNFGLVELGERLLQQNQNDAAVKYRLSEDCSDLASKKFQENHVVDQKLKQRAVSLVEQIIAVQPSNPDNYTALAAVYSTSFADRKNPEDASKALTAYQQYLKRAAPDDYFRPQCQGIVAMLKEYLAANPMPPQHASLGSE